MRQYRMSVLAGLFTLLGAIATTVTAAQPSARLLTDPPANQLIPFEAEASHRQSPTRLTVQVLDANGQPLNSANVHLKLLTPPRNAWFSTDFPIVEGTELLEMNTQVTEGQLQFQQMLPIRGVYQLQVTAIAPTSSVAPVQQTLTLSVSENWVKYRNLTALLSVLLLVGFAGGWVIGGKQVSQPGELAPQRVRLLLSGTTILTIATLLVINIQAERFLSHDHSHHHDSAAIAEELPQRESQGITLKLLADDHAIVGQPADLAVQVTNTKTGQPITDVKLNIQTTQLEDQWVAFAYQGEPDASGQFHWRQQFFDGAPHRVSVDVSPKPGSPKLFQPFQVAQSVEVEAVAPPLLGRLLALAYFTSVIAIGLGAGLWLKHRWALQPERAG